MSLYIKILLSTQIDLKNDFEIAKQLFEIYNVKISRRTVCDIRNKYLIPNIKKIEKKISPCILIILIIIKNF